MKHVFFEKVAMVGFGLTALGAAVCLALKQPLWAAGVWVGAFWIFLNTFFLFGLIEIGFTGKPVQAVAGHKPPVMNKILLFSILKFPVLYGAGFFILKARIFPAMGLLLGLTLFMIAFGVVWFLMNADLKNRQGAAS
jgi:hypothetical protein